MIVAKKRGLVYFFLQPVLDHIIQRIRRDGEVGQLVDEREDAGPAHGDARDAGVALRLAGLCEDLHAVAFGAAVKQTIIAKEFLIMQTIQKKGLTVKDLVTIGIFSALFLNGLHD